MAEGEGRRREALLVFPQGGAVVKHVGCGALLL